MSTLQKQISRFTFSLVITPLLAASLSAQNVVSQWNAIASTTIVANGKEVPGASAVWLAYVHLAVFDAVNAIDHRFRPYLFTANPPPRGKQRYSQLPLPWDYFRLARRPFPIGFVDPSARARPNTRSVACHESLHLCPFSP